MKRERERGGGGGVKRLGPLCLAKSSSNNKVVYGDVCGAPYDGHADYTGSECECVWLGRDRPRTSIPTCIGSGERLQALKIKRSCELARA